MTSPGITLTDTIGPLSVRHYADTPNRHELNQLLHAVLIPVCQSFAAEAGPNVDRRALLHEFPIGNVHETGESPDNPSIGWLRDGWDPELAPDTHLYIPVGQYGFGFGSTLWYATCQVVQDWRDYVKANPALVLAAHESEEHRALAVSTFQRVPSDTVCEGIQSVGQALSQLCSYVVPGYEERPDRLLTAILQSGVVNDYTALLNFSTLANLCSDGKCHPVAPLKTVEPDSLRISPELREKLWPRRQADAVEWREALERLEYRRSHAKSRKAARGGGCPGRRGAIDIFTGLIVRQALMILHGRARIPRSALGEMSKHRVEPLVIPLAQRSRQQPQCPIHTGLAGA